ncbi:hypothetical protein HGG72_00460 [Ochrobactrum pecoris]|nr:hypothetical protein [Brucella pecoris]
MHGAFARLPDNQTHALVIADGRSMPNRPNVPAVISRLYKQRNAAERLFNKLKHFRAVAARYEKRDDNFLTSIRIWLRSYESTAKIIFLAQGSLRSHCTSLSEYNKFESTYRIDDRIYIINLILYSWYGYRGGVYIRK